MSNQWFRMYAEVLNDPKVQKLSPELFKFWVNALCLACNGNGTLPKLEDCSFAFRMPFHETKTAFQELEKVEIIVTVGETFQFKNWKKRQYKSDTSTERVKQFRKRSRNVSETPPEQNRTDTDTEQKESKSISAQPKIDFDFTLIAFTGIEEIVLQKWEEAYPAVDIPHQIKEAAVWLHANPANRKKNYSRFLSQWFSRQQERSGRMPANNFKSFEQIAKDKTDLAIEEARKRYADPN